MTSAAQPHVPICGSRAKIVVIRVGAEQDLADYG